MPTLTLTDKYKNTRDAAPEKIRWELEDLETELRRNRLASGRKQENIYCRTKETLHSYRVNKDWRLITYKWTDNEIILLLAGKHDDAYRQAENLRLEWTKGKSALPTVKEEEPVVIKIKPTKVPVIETQPEKPVEEQKPAIPADAKPFAEYTQEQLLKLGVPKEQVDRVRGATYKEIVAADFVEVEVGCTLIDLAEGKTTYEREIDRIETERKRPPVEKVLNKHPEMREHYFVLTDESRDAFLNGELENWQLFLHHTQREAVEKKVNGPVLVSGPAGTGKSVVAFHRVKWLLRQKGFEGKRILFTTYTKTLAQYAEAMLKKLCTEEELGRVDVMTFDAFLRDAWTQGIAGQTGFTKTYKDNPYGLPRPLKEALDALFGTRRQYWNDRDRDFIAREYVNVILENDIRTLEAYKNVQRPRTYGLLRTEMRERFWPVFDEWNGILAKFKRAKYRPKVAALNALTTALLSPVPNADKAYLLGRYGAVVVDEAQDFGASEYRFLAALTGNTIDHPQPTLYLAGDGHQRIYGRIGAFSQCNINVVNRSFKLTVCYRSTGAIREFAENLLKGVEVKGFDDEFESLGGESLVQGEPPEEKYFSNYTDENDAIANAIQRWRERASKKFGDYAVLLRSNRGLRAVVNALEARGVSAALVTNEDELDLNDNRVKVMTMHRAKGLQFVGVVLVLDDWPIIPKDLDHTDSDAIEEQMLSERQLLYMAAMRAQRFLLLTSSKGHPADIEQ